MARSFVDAESVTWLLCHCGRKGTAMTAEILKRKIRNFPAANLSIRIATA
jgi:hypothetical protein